MAAFHGRHPHRGGPRRARDVQRRRALRRSPCRRGARRQIAIECGDERVTYAQLAERVNRFGRALRDAARRPAGRARRCSCCSTRPPSPTRSSARSRSARCRFPLNTLWKPADYRYVLNDSRARVADRQRSAAAADRRDDPRRRAVARARRGRRAAPTRRRPTEFADAGRAGSPRARGRADAAATRRRSGSIRRAAPARPRAACTCSTTWSICAELFGKGVLGISRARSLLQRRQAVLRLRPRQRAVLSARGRRAPASSGRGRRRPRTCTRRSSGTGRRCSSRCRPATACCSRSDAATTSICRRSGWRSRPAKRCRPRSTSASSSASASTSSTASAPPKRCTCSSRIVPAPSVRDRAGCSCPATTRAILDDDRRPVPRGEIGNLWINGDSTCAGYWNQHEKTKDDDRRRLDPHRRQVHAGRRRLLLVRRPQRRHAEGRRPVGQPGRGRERADRARRGAGVRGGRPRGSRRADQAGGLRRAPRGRRGTPALADELQQFVRARLADYKRPRWVEFVPELPKTATGKIQRFKLRAIV